MLYARILSLRGNDCFGLDFVERETTAELAMKLSIRLHLAGPLLADTVTALGELGVDRCSTFVHNWIQKADLHLFDGANPDVAVDETMFQLNDEQYWLQTAVDRATNRLLHARLYPPRITAVSSIFLSELRKTSGL